MKSVLFFFVFIISAGSWAQDTLLSHDYYFHLAKTNLHEDRLFKLDSVYSLLTQDHNPDSVEVIYSSKVLKVSSVRYSQRRADSIAHYLSSKNARIKFKSKGISIGVDHFNSKDPTYFQPDISFISYFNDFPIHLVAVLSPIDLFCLDSFKLQIFEEDELILDSGFDTNMIFKIDTNLIQKNKKYTLKTFSKGGHTFPTSEDIYTYNYSTKTRIIREYRMVRALVHFEPFPDYSYSKKQDQLDPKSIEQLEGVVAFLNFHCLSFISLRYYSKSSKQNKTDTKRLKQLLDYFKDAGLSERISVDFIQDKEKANTVDFRLKGVE